MKCVMHFIFIIAFSWFHSARPSPPVTSLDRANLNLGLTVAHIEKLQEWADKNKVALFIRKSEPDTVRLIKDGEFGTKSVDIHNKSSNWGPQRGTVPVDPFFSKKVGQQNGNFGTKMTMNILKERQKAINEAKDHEKAVKDASMKNGVDTMQLVISNELLTEYLTTSELLVEVKEECGGKGKGAWKCLKENEKNWEGKLHKEALKTRFLVQEFENDAKKKQWKVYVYAEGKPEPEPLYVWAYTSNKKKAAVTGDYDLWMVAPHINSPLIIGKTSTERYKDIASIVSKPIKGGQTTVTPFDFRLVTQTINQMLDRGTFPVFHHGSEMKNYGFLQELDKILYVIVPKGEKNPMKYAVDTKEENFQPLESGMIQDGTIPQFLAAIRRFGYFAMPNPLHGFEDPTYGGKKSDDVVAQMEKDGRSEDAINAFKAAFEASKKLSNDFIMKQRGYADPKNHKNPLKVMGDCKLSDTVYQSLFKLFAITYDLRIKEAGLLKSAGVKGLGNWKRNIDKTEPELLKDAVAIWDKVVQDQTAQCR